MQKCNALKILFQRLFGLVLLSCLLSGAVSVAAQTRRAATKPKTATTAKTATKKQNPYDPSSGWSGTVTYTKTLVDTLQSDEPGIRKNIDRIIHNNSRNYKYEGKLFVDASGEQIVTNTQVIFSDEDKRHGIEKVWDSCGAWKPEHWFIIDGKTDVITKAFAEGAADGFNFYVGFLNDNSYRFSFRFPKAKGTYNKETHVKRSGHCQPKNNEPFDDSRTEPTFVDGESVSIDGRRDPENPDVISGTKTWGGEKTTGGVPTFKYTVTWNFRQNPGELEIENIAFDEHPYPDWNSWKENTEGEIVDSNIVRIRARIVNYSRETKFPKIEFKETKENILLDGGETNISIAPGEQREVEYIWDTSGFAWGVGAKPMSDRQIKVVLTENQVKEKTKDVLIIPKPVILAHGLWADYTAWDGYDKFLYKFHSMAWHSYAVGADPANGVMNTGEKGTLKQTNSIIQNAEQLGKQIEFVQKKWNAWHVDVVAHSMGGIITRSYINDRMTVVPDGKPTIQHLVQLGTPNMGSPCANLIHRTIAPLGTTVTALAQLDKGYMHGFNKVVLNRKGTRFSNLVGTIVPATCISPLNGDGVVEVMSAVWQIYDVRFVPEIHTKLTDEQYFRRFVLKRLAVSRNGNHAPDKNYPMPAPTTGAFRQNENPVRFVNAAWNGENARRNERTGFDEIADTDNESQDFQINAGKQVQLQPKQTTEIEIPISSAGNSGITIVAPPQISATLLDETGAIVGKNIAGTPEAGSDFRVISIDKPMNAAWKLKLENTGAKEAGAIISAWTMTNPNRVSFILTAEKPNAAGQVLLNAKLNNNASPVSGASVKAKLRTDDDKTIEIVLLDDGKNGDGAAGDGIYGAATEKLANGEYSVEASAEIEGQTRLAAVSFEIGAAETKNLTRKKTKK